MALPLSFPLLKRNSLFHFFLHNALQRMCG
uniref:Uncharacterized protein n=1 Tax=Rhizophora mucronata TaxID=61149 RepID=A0A2P2NXB3_RHIMU